MDKTAPPGPPDGGKLGVREGELHNAALGVSVTGVGERPAADVGGNTGDEIDAEEPGYALVGGDGMGAVVGVAATPAGRAGEESPDGETRQLQERHVCSGVLGVTVVVAITEEPAPTLAHAMAPRLTEGE